MADAVIDLTNVSDTASESGSENGSSLSDEVQVPPALEDTGREQLRVAIDNVPEDRLRAIVKELVDSAPAVEAAMMQKLVATKKPKKRAAVEVLPRWEVCMHCEEEYDASTRRRTGECRYHSGDLEVDEDSFVDWDEDCHGPMDTPAKRRAWPENFIWNCCDADGRSEGCEDAKHVPGGHRKTRARY
ncbi:hypothetical protein BKA93DRAFT_736658 [Sparassis latifolia]|uniref:Uncharacterized protein n=1 Tax=Sparassis crispa TaxID=139825 RepID=A0A401H1B9_9APHY|nr:hypothetical protein SCP_1300410 [Sparassis crispa]GBE88227.1 hypothetical protein SCP_1300410 [Sparassis crispa]